MDDAYRRSDDGIFDLDDAIGIVAVLAVMAYGKARQPIRQTPPQNGDPPGIAPEPDSRWHGYAFRAGKIAVTVLFGRFI
jgi:hypothetical protein